MAPMAILANCPVWALAVGVNRAAVSEPKARYSGVLMSRWGASSLSAQTYSPAAGRFPAWLGRTGKPAAWARSSSSTGRPC